MKDRPRTALFISHANPEDNAFTIWLGAKLSVMGYEVWADVLRLKGGDDWQRKLEHALRNRTCKMLVVATPDGVEKQGVRNEIQIASDVARTIADSEFIIPLRMAAFESPFLIAHAQYIDFQPSWSQGLTELLETLEDGYDVPRVTNDLAQVWRDVHIRHSKQVRYEPEQLISNWLAIDEVPLRIRLFDFKAGISIGMAQGRINDAPRPLVPYRRGFLTFARSDDLQDHFGPNLPLVIADECDTRSFLDEGWKAQDISQRDARNRFTDLVRQGLEGLFRSRGLTSTEMANGQLAWWGAAGTVPDGQIAFRWSESVIGRRQIIGVSEKRKVHWHFGISAVARTSPLAHVRFSSRLIFTSDGRTALDPSRIQRLRRSFAKSWRNARWRDMQLAFLHWLTDGAASLPVPLGSEVALTMHLPPLTFPSPVSIDPGVEISEPDDDDPSDDELEAFDPDDTPDDDDGPRSGG